MGCPVSTDTASREPPVGNSAEVHDDGRPLTPITNDPLPGELSKSYVGRVDLTGDRDSAVPNIEEELFMFGDFSVARTKPKQLRPRPPASRVGSKEVKDGDTKDTKAVIWGEFTTPLVDDFDPVDNRNQPSPPHESNQNEPGAEEEPKSPSEQPRKPVSPQKTPGQRQIDHFAVKTAIGHGSRVKCIAIAPGEKEYVSCSNEDISIALFGLETGRELGMFTGHQDTIINATFSYDGKYLATTSRDHTMILWDVVTTKQILTFEHGKVVICCCFSKDSRFVATGCQDKVCRVWETRKGREVLIFAQHEGIIIAMCYAPDNSHIVSASADKTLRVWSSTNGRCKHLLQGHAGIVLSCVYTADGKRIVSNDEKLLRVWNAADGTCTLSLSVDDVAKVPRGPPQRKVTWTLSTAAPGEFGNFVIVACNNRFVYILNADTGEEVTSHFCKAPVYCLAMGHANRAAVGDSFGNVYHFRFR